MHRQLFWLTGVLLVACSRAPAPAPAPETPQQQPAARFAPEDVAVSQLQAAMAEGRLSARDLVELYRARIAALDDAGPRLNAVIELNPDALAEAERLDAERAAGQVRGPLHGIPVLLKDNIDATGMATSAGSLALAGHRPTRDAHLVARLRESGAIVLGKANLSEWANFRSTRSASGWSAVGGQTRNPYILDRSPCGSSSGSAVAVAAGLAPLAVGTETNGSILCPAAVNGVVGIKPTVGLVSRHGIVPISPAQDTAGPMAQRVADAAALLNGLAGADTRDEATSSATGHIHDDYTVFLDPDGLRGARIGVMRKAMGFHDGVDQVMEAAISALRAAGAEIVDPADLSTHGQFGRPSFDALLHEFRPALEAYLHESGAPVRTLDALMEFNRDNAGRQMSWFGQELFEMAAEKGPLTDPAYRRAREQARRLAGPRGIDATIARHRLDALLTTAVSPAWTVDPVNGDHFRGAGYSAAAVAGYPSVTVPAGQVHGLPVGIVFMGPAWSEPRLIAIAYAFERATQARRPPGLRSTLLE
ncbi:MAG: amidase [Gammaproteobacteria bacterium]